MEFVDGMTYEQFASDKRTFRAVCQCLLIISEAAVKLADAANDYAPNRDWRGIRALGNRIRHEYDRIKPERVWKIVENDIVSLRDDCEPALARLESDQT